MHIMQLYNSLPQSKESTLPQHVLQIILISSLLHLGLQIVVSSGLLIKTMYTPSLSPICATCPANPILLLFNTLIIWAGKTNVEIAKN